MEASPTFQNIPPDKQRRVLDEAQKEFAERGFLGASMNRLAARLGIAKGSIFKYFGSKEGLFAKVFDGAVEHFSGFLRKSRDETVGRPLAERLERLLVVGTDFVRTHPDIYRIYLKMLFNEDFPLRERFLGQVRALSARFLTPIIEQAKASGELPASLETPLAVFVLDAVLDRFVQSQAQSWMDTGLHLSLSDPETSRRAASRLAEMLAGGFRVG
ncbi:TetR/AcrR family transcriptional regulator [Fundidesulfovibrio terrae]|uniref:TetR/AcrR family transcriptional regulator n=1 Tax=Fundidesulfovibrio terrae TaxID=2922866 RepID=UPI001FAF7BA4|nr:TetR/AcrR family transcriptional regulator [Fundidesulfovibrio terrae]